MERNNPPQKHYGHSSWRPRPLWSDFSFLYSRNTPLNQVPKVRQCEYFKATTRHSSVTSVEKVLSCCWPRWGCDLNVLKCTCLECRHWFPHDYAQYQRVRTSCLRFFCISIISGAPEGRQWAPTRGSIFPLKRDCVFFQLSAGSSQAWSPEPGWIKLPEVLAILRSFSRTVRNQSREFQALQSIC